MNLLALSIHKKIKNKIKTKTISQSCFPLSCINNALYRQIKKKKPNHVTYNSFLFVYAVKPPFNILKSTRFYPK